MKIKLDKNLIILIVSVLTTAAIVFVWLFTEYKDELSEQKLRYKAQITDLLSQVDKLKSVQKVNNSYYIFDESYYCSRHDVGFLTTESVIQSLDQIASPERKLDGMGNRLIEKIKKSVSVEAVPDYEAWYSPFCLSQHYADVIFMINNGYDYFVGRYNDSNGEFVVSKTDVQGDPYRCKFNNVLDSGFTFSCKPYAEGGNGTSLYYYDSEKNKIITLEDCGFTESVGVDPGHPAYSYNSWCFGEIKNLLK